MDTIKQNYILNTKNNVVLPWIKYLENKIFFKSISKKQHEKRFGLNI